jgi:hypothetical protein
MIELLIKNGLGRHVPPMYVYVGGCHMAGKRLNGVLRAEALRALADRVDPCPHCRPDSEPKDPGLMPGEALISDGAHDLVRGSEPDHRPDHGTGRPDDRADHGRPARFAAQPALRLSAHAW